jgi:hypothetical protein
MYLTSFAVFNTRLLLFNCFPSRDVNNVNSLESANEMRIYALTCF